MAETESPLVDELPVATTLNAADAPAPTDAPLTQDAPAALLPPAEDTQPTAQPDDTTVNPAPLNPPTEENTALPQEAASDDIDVRYLQLMDERASAEITAWISGYELRDVPEQQQPPAKPVKPDVIPIDALDTGELFLTQPFKALPQAINEVGEGIEDLTNDVVSIPKLPEFEKADTETKQAFRDMSSFMIKFFAFRSQASKVTPKTGPLSGDIAKDTAASSLAGFFSDPNVKTLVDDLATKPWLQEILGPLSKGEDDSDMVKRMKNAAQDAGFGVMFDNFVKLSKAGLAKWLTSKPKPTLAEKVPGAPKLEPADLITRLPKGSKVTPEELLERGAVKIDDNNFINFSRIEEPDDVKVVMANMAEIFQKDIDKIKGGKQSHAATKKLADEMGMSVDELKKRRQGKSLVASEIVAARQLMAATGKHLQETAVKAADGGPEALIEFRRMVAVHRAVEAETLGAQAEIARALSSFRIPVSGEERASAISRMIQETGGEAVSREMAKRVATLTTPQARALMLRRGFAARTVDAVKESYVLGLLWTPKTHVVNVLGNMSALTQSIVERRVAEGLNKVVGVAGDDSVVAGEAAMMAIALKESWRDAIRSATQSTLGKKTVAPGSDRLAMESGQAGGAISSANFGGQGTKTGNVIDFIGTAVRAPGAALQFNDEIFKTLSFRAEVYAHALRTGTREGLEGEELASRVTQLINDPPDHIKLAAADTALLNTFQNKTGKIGELLMSARSGSGLLGLASTALLPFAKTPVNLIRFGIERSPLAPLSAQWLQDMAAGGARREIATAKITTGYITSALALDLAQAGHITGGGPPKNMRGLRASLKRSGWQQYSLRVGNTYYSLQSLDPTLAMTMGMAGDLHDLYTRFDVPDGHGEVMGLQAAYTAALTRALSNKSYLKSFGDLEALMLTEDEDERTRIWSSMGAGFVPGSTLGRTLSKVEDPVLRDIRTARDHFLAAIPVLQKQLNPRRTLWGDEMIGLGGRAGVVNPTPSKELKPEPIDAAMANFGAKKTPIGWKTTFSGVKVNFEKFPKVLDKYRVLAGNEVRVLMYGDEGAKDTLNKIVSNKHDLSFAYNMRNTDMWRGLYIDKVIGQYRKAAQQDILTNPKYDDIEEFKEFRAYVQQQIDGQPSELDLDNM